MAESDLEQELLTRFSCMGTSDREVLINELQSLVGVHLSGEACAFFLEMSNWNLQTAIGAYFDYYNANSLPELSLVRDITTGEGEAVPRGTVFTKTWRVKNTGPEPWPGGVYLSFRGGDRLEGPSVVPLPALQAGCEVDVEVRLRSPEQPGLYQSQWQMCTMSGNMCGEVIWVIINVDNNGVMNLTQQMATFSTQEESWDPVPLPYPTPYLTSPFPPSDMEGCGLHSDGLVRTHDSDEPSLNSDLEALAPVTHKSSLDDMQL